MIRRRTSVTGLAIATTALFVITLSVGAVSAAPATAEKTPPTPVPEAATPQPTPVVPEPCVGDAVAAPFAAFDGLELNYTPVTPAEDALPDGAARPPHRHGYCRCSCGYPCQTSADCGGSSCDPFITCC